MRVNREDILLIQKILKNEDVEDSDFKKLTNKVDLIVEQIHAQDKITEIGKKLHEIETNGKVEK